MMPDQLGMTLDEKIALQISKIADATRVLPCVTIIHNLANGAVIWMCERGLKQLGLNLKNLVKLSADDYYNRYFNPEDAKIYKPKILDLLARNNDDESVSYLQQVKIHDQDFWTWHRSCTKILMRDDMNRPVLLITQSIAIEPTDSICAKADKILVEKTFLNERLEIFSKLSKRELEVLKYLASGETAAECGQKLFISPQTVDTHRKNIRKKLGTASFTELLKYARAFDLISLFMVNKLIGFLTSAEQIVSGTL